MSGCWVVRGEKLVPFSMEAMRNVLQEHVPGWLTVLAERLAVESLADIDDIRLSVDDTVKRLTIAMDANGHTATETWTLPSTLIQ